MSQRLPKNDSDASPILKAALTYAKRGIKVFATTADGKAPSTSNDQWGKRLGRVLRRGEGGLHRATTDEDTIRWMFSFRSAGGIGMPCGKVNGLIVSDFDTHKDGDEGRNANAVFDEWRDEISEAQTVRTRNGGWHVYWAYEEGHGKHELGKGIEVQTDGSYVLLPPSKGYIWGNRIDREEWGPPPWDGVANKGATVRVSDTVAVTPPEVLADIDKIMSKETWHDPMVRIVAHLWGSGWSDAEIIRKMVPLGHPHFDALRVVDDVAVAIDGARMKWTKDNSPKTTDQARIDRIALLFGRCSPPAKKFIMETLKEAMKDDG
jgi:hypothetical protein